MTPLPRRAVWLLVALVGLIVAGLGLHGLSTLVSSEDLTLVRDAAQDRSADATALAHAASWLGRSAVLVPAAVGLGLVAAAAHRPWRGAALIVGILGAIVIQNVDKALVGRPRPPVGELERVSGTSFPSGHATESSAFFIALAMLLVAGIAPRGARLVLALATLVIIASVALSRVYLGVHYPTDVAAGILLGGSWGAITTTTLGASGQSHVRS
jgi:undecaprenyl-diphosphatase